MKTTIDLPKDVLHRARLVAAQRRITLKELVLQGLEYATREPAQEARKTTYKRLLAKMQASSTKPMAPLESAAQK